MGAVDAGRKTAAKVLKEGLSVAVYPGGSREIFSTVRGVLGFRVWGLGNG